MVTRDKEAEWRRPHALVTPQRWLLCTCTGEATVGRESILFSVNEEVQHHQKSGVFWADVARYFIVYIPVDIYNLYVYMFFGLPKKHQGNMRVYA